MKKKIFVLLLLLVLLLSPFFGFVSSAAGEVGNEGSSSFSESLSEKKPLPDEPGDIENVVLDANGQPLKPDGVETEETNEGPGGHRYNPFFDMSLRSRTTLPPHMILICLIGVIIPVVGIFVIFRCEPNRAASMLLVSDLICLIYNATYFLSLNTTGLDEAVLAMKMNFLTNMLFYLFYILFMQHYLGVRKRFLFIGYAILSAFVLFVLWDNTFSTLIYNNPKFITETLGGSTISYLRFDKGILYYINNAYIALLLIVLFVSTVLRLRKTHSSYEKKNLKRLSIAQIIIVAVIALMTFVKPDYDFMPLAASVSVLYLMIGVMSGDFFGVVEWARKRVYDKWGGASITVNNNYEYLDANEKAHELFPEVNGLTTGTPLPSELMNYFTNCPVGGEKNEDGPSSHFFDEYRFNGRYYRAFLTPLEGRKRFFSKGKDKASGYCLMFFDTTEQFELFKKANEEREKAISAAKSKSDFLSNMSHEIRTPMNAIVGMTEILMREDLPPEAKGYLLNIKNSGDSLLSIINDILDFSKIESGKLEIINDDYEPMSMLSDLSMIILNRIGEKPIELLFDIDKNLPHLLYGDNIRIRQVLTNILNNAVKFTEEGFVKLTLKIESVEGEDIHLLFEVEDSGQGIKEEDLSKLFGSFSQVDTKKNRKKEGTGLGLAISKNLVSAMGGTISVSSEYGKGSVFSFDIYQKIQDQTPAAEIRPENKDSVVTGAFSSDLLEEALIKLCGDHGVRHVPFLDVLDGKEDAGIIFLDSKTHEKYEDFVEDPAISKKTRHIIIKNPMTEDPDSSEYSVNKPLYSLNFCQAINRDTITAFESHAQEVNFIAPEAKILIVDDNEMNLKVARGLLSPLQMTIDTAQSGKAALEKIVDDSYDIIFMDHMMPEMDGVECTKEIRSRNSDYMKNVPVIALTANALAGAKEEFLSAGMNDFVPKPIEMSTICSKIKQYLPREKVKSHKITIDSPAESNDLPSLPGIDSKEGIKNSGSKELFFSFLGDFYRLIDMKTAKVRDCLENGFIKDYTIEVHALKSTARTIGAMELSDKFFMLEKAGDKNDLETINSETEKVLSEYNALKEVLRPFADDGDDSDKREASYDEIIDILSAIKECADAFDIDGVDSALSSLKEIRLPEETTDHMTRLTALVADVATDEIIEEADIIIGLLKKEQ